MLEKASKLFDRVLQARVPIITLPLNTIQTPCIPSAQAQTKLSVRLTLESVESKPMGFWAPVRIIGFGLP